MNNQHIKIDQILFGKILWPMLLQVVPKILATHSLSQGKARSMRLDVTGGNNWAIMDLVITIIVAR